MRTFRRIVELGTLSVKRLHVIGRKNHGKTTLMIELVACLKQAGCRVGTIKHTHHRHELDTPGKDSYRHRQAGADVVGILSRSMNAVFWPPLEDGSVDRYAAFEPLFAACDIVLVEGDTLAAAPKIEVWRAQLGTEPIAGGDPSVLAVVSDDRLEIPVPVLPRSDVPGLAAWLRERLGSAVQPTVR
jgi:molybdopterin-guanine dinucleotide biosynthesis protein MobB